MSTQQCVHCGTDCGSSPIVWENKPFCCHGCKTVYQILKQSELEQYYEIQPMSGIRVEAPPPLKKFAFLDMPEISDKLLDFKEGNRSKVRLFIPAIHCASCIWLLEHLHTLHHGILYSSVNFPKKEVHISFQNDLISLRQLVELLASIHYVPEITLQDMEGSTSRKSDRKLLIKLGIAGFSFLNIMTYSLAEYVPGGDAIDPKLKQLFAILSFVLILPVVLYSANDYYLSAWKGLKHKIISIDLPITLGILALFLQSSWEVFSGTGIGYMDSLAGLLFFLLTGKWYQGKTYQALSFERDYRSYFPIAVTKVEQKKEVIMPIRELRKGDTILIRNQELIPADALLTEGRANIDYSFVTGEAIPQSRHPGNLIFAGGRQVGSTIKLIIEKPVEQSYLTQLWNQSEQKSEKLSLDNLINQISQYFTAIVLIIAFTSFFYWIATDLRTAVYVFSSVLIIACPCALALTVPFTFGSTMRVFGKRGFYIKSTDVVEKIYRTTCLVFDKTGTLTLNRKMKTRFEGEPLTSSEQQLIRSLVQHSSHPLSTALYDTLPAIESLEVDQYEEIPGLGITAVIGTQRINIGSRLFVTGSETGEDAQESRVYIGFGNQMRGFFRFSNLYRANLKQVIDTLSHKYELHLISGDNDAERTRLETIFGPSAELHFNQSPTEKKQYIENLKKQGKQVLMIGDGLNDAGALHESDAGISIADDVFSFSPASDAILDAKQFAKLDKFICFTKQSFKVIRLSLLISFFYNVIGLSFAVSAKLSPLVAAILMPLSSVSVVAFATLTVTLLAQKKLNPELSTH